jgi:ABC-type multidrug transport system fused ATPase/permease subunit
VLVELGSHDELINIPDGRYRYLYEMQFASSKEEV